MRVPSGREVGGGGMVSSEEIAMTWNKWISVGCAAFGVCVVGVGDLNAQLPPVPAGATLLAQGIFGPRGLKLGPDGDLYVALSGSGGSHSTAAVCPQLQVATAVGGPYTNGDTASIIKVDKRGKVSTVASGFPSALSQRPDVMGVADVAFLDGQLYALVSGGGCSHGASTPNMVAKVDAESGHWTMLANMSAAVMAHPVAVTPPDFEADGVFYNLIAARGKLFAVESNHGQIWSITRRGDVEMVTDVSKAEGHIVPTSTVESDGGLLVSNLGRFPITLDSSVVLTLRPGCADWLGYPLRDCGPGTLNVTNSASPGLTTVVAMDWGPDGELYLLELSEPNPKTEEPPFFPNPGDGKVVRIRRGVAEDVITGLSVPTGMTFGPDGALYISNWGAADAPIGQILRYNVH
jgi:hypothetical protein